MTNYPYIETLSGLINGTVAPGKVPETQWSGLITRALWNGLGPMLYWRCKAAECLGNVNHWQQLRNSAITCGALHAMLERAQQQIDQVLKHTGISVIWLKGIVFAGTIYPEPYLRPMSDLDVLIPEQDSQAAIQALEKVGYYVIDDSGHLIGENDPLKEKTSHHYTLTGGVGSSVHLELHYNMLGSGASFLPKTQLEWFRKQVKTYSFDRKEIIGLTPEAALLYAVGHALIQHGMVEFYLLWFLDMHLLVRQYELDWGIVVDQAVSLKWTYAVEYALTICNYLFHTPVPKEVFADLRTLRPDKEDPEIVIRAGENGIRWEKVQRRLLNLSLKEALPIAWRIAFPPPEYVRLHYKVPPDSPLAPWYLHRWKDQLLEVGAWTKNRFRNNRRRKTQ